jgi:hypothetical protein
MLLEMGYRLVCLFVLVGTGCMGKQAAAGYWLGQCNSCCDRLQDAFVAGGEHTNNTVIIVPRLLLHN